ncbi:hypothetical protein Q4F19_06330 [Sphingomonas sp. BIUV-7]|uniref:Tox-REase-5 domain-containing protein n=1 Tax=Sphingomonas natans TaxID=3063330 RepID=A0ABT8Y6P6_9SPHN|nr:hypothetical protein [Sphingomonas sp. BIUV-7]MDO6413993.1 hypothetical protein [Sphingomonas sp. BIUV-7]
MDEIQGQMGRRAFVGWLRTGRSPAGRIDRVELKFNPWHDPDDGRFTFAGTGRRFGTGGADPADQISGRASGIFGRPSIGDRNRPRIPATPKVQAPRAQQRVGNDAGVIDRRPAIVPLKVVPGLRLVNQSNPVTEFVGGAGRELRDLANETVTGVRSALTTNPVTTVRNAALGIAGMIDAGIAADDVPARVQISRAADALANASARDIGRAGAYVVGNAALTLAPGAALSKVSALRGLRKARLRPTYDPPEIGWAKETLDRDKPWAAYNDAAPGAQAGQAPTLKRKLPNGLERAVKFDGVQGDYVIDRKWKIVDAPHARAQLLRQSEVLRRHNVIGTWEVPDQKQRMKALMLFKKMNVTNIKVRVVKP